MTNAQLNNNFNLTETVLNFLLSCGFSIVTDHVDIPIPYLDYNTGDAYNYYRCMGLYNREYDNYYYLVSFSDTDDIVFNNIMLIQHNNVYGDFYSNCINSDFFSVFNSTDKFKYSFIDSKVIVGATFSVRYEDNEFLVLTSSEDNNTICFSRCVGGLDRREVVYQTIFSVKDWYFTASSNIGNMATMYKGLDFMVIGKLDTISQDINPLYVYNDIKFGGKYTSEDDVPYSIYVHNSLHRMFVPVELDSIDVDKGSKIKHYSFSGSYETTFAYYAFRDVTDTEKLNHVDYNCVFAKRVIPLSVSSEYVPTYKYFYDIANVNSFNAEMTTDLICSNLRKPTRMLSTLNGNPKLFPFVLYAVREPTSATMFSPILENDYYQVSDSLYLMPNDTTGMVKKYINIGRDSSDSLGTSPSFAYTKGKEISEYLCVDDGKDFLIDFCKMASIEGHSIFDIDYNPLIDGHNSINVDVMAYSGALNSKIPRGSVYLNVPYTKYDYIVLEFTTMSGEVRLRRKIRHKKLAKLLNNVYNRDINSVPSNPLIVAIGDGYTSGFPYTSDCPSITDDLFSWVHVVSRNTGFTVINKGKFEDTYENEQARFNSDVIALNPDVVIIGGGATECWTTSNIDIEKMQAYLESMIKDCLSLGILPIINQCNILTLLHLRAINDLLSKKYTEAELYKILNNFNILTIMQNKLCDKYKLPKINTMLPISGYTLSSIPLKYFYMSDISYARDNKYPSSEGYNRMGNYVTNELLSILEVVRNGDIINLLGDNEYGLYWNIDTNASTDTYLECTGINCGIVNIYGYGEV